MPPLSLNEIYPYQVQDKDPDIRIEWSVTNRFRLIDDTVESDEKSEDGGPGLGDEARFYRDLALETVEYERWYHDENGKNIWLVEPHFDLIRDNPKSGRPFRNYKTRYTPVTASYRCRLAGDARKWDRACPTDGSEADWIADQSRTVVLTLAHATAKQCIWTVDGVAQTDSCTVHKITTQLEKPSTVVVQMIGDNSAQTFSADPIVVRDVKIVALGDSFSAGEGIPHAQWRWFFTGNRPAIWLDPRCHRSLLSGPSLAAAYIAKNNPHLSVTLLHYGCSGASVADGVLGPWGYLESDQDVKKKAAQFAPLPIWQGQDTSRIGGSADAPDVGLSQIEQARADLSIDGVTSTTPDAVLISVGGNDIGFAGIISGLIGDLLAPKDLKPKPPADTRSVTTFDEAMWQQISAASQTRCWDPPERNLKKLDCMAFEAKPRIGDQATEHDQIFKDGVRYLDRQYEALRAGLNGLVPAQQNRIFITQYPYFVYRAKKSPNEKTVNVDGQEAVGCVDRVLDGDPDMIPAVAAWLPWFGLKAGSADKARTEFEDPLNKEIQDVADRLPDQKWNVVHSDLADTVQHGYCARERYFNTMVDSYWYQGRKYGPDRELGNIQFLKDEFGFKAGDRIAWDAHGPTPCFRRWRYANENLGPIDMGCIVETGALKAELHQTLPPRTKRTWFDIHTRDYFTTGPVHPNLYGHCTYAAGIVLSIVTNNPSQIPFDPDFQARVLSANGFHTKDICTPEAWGWKSKHDEWNYPPHASILADNP